MEMIPQEAMEIDCVQHSSAIPFRRREGHWEFCLITTSSGRWIFPKGIVDPGETAQETALKEAYEEAGLHGQILAGPLGSFTWEKASLGQISSVSTFLMQVDRVDANWLESEWRDRRWVSLSEAEQLLDSQEAIDLLAVALDWLQDHRD